MSFKRFVLGFLAGMVLFNCHTKSQAAIFSTQSFLDAISRKAPDKICNDEIPDCIGGVLRMQVSRVLYVMQSYWNMGSIYEMLVRFGFPGMFRVDVADYLAELTGNNISSEERAMLRSSQTLDEIKTNLQRMIIAYEFFIKSIKKQFPEVVRAWIDENYPQVWRFGSEIEATAEPLYKISRADKPRRTTVLLEKSMRVSGLAEQTEVAPGNAPKRVRWRRRMVVLNGLKGVSLDDLQPIPRNIARKDAKK